MTEYNDIKDLIIWNDPILGEISLDFIITGLQELLNEQTKFEDIVYHLLENANYDNETISSLFTLSKIDLINTYLKMIKDEL